MALITELFSSEYGIMSAIVIALLLIMAFYFIWLFIKKSGEQTSISDKE